MRYCFKPDGLAVVDRLTELSKNRFAAMLTGKSKGAETLESFIQKKQELHARIEEVSFPRLTLRESKDIDGS